MRASHDLPLRRFGATDLLVTPLCLGCAPLADMPDPECFPGGIQALAEHVHGLGLKLGIYSDAAERTCAGYPGSYGFEEQDAQLWAAWGVDFLKYDYSHAPIDQASAIEQYRRMGAVLRNTGREILFSLCEWGGCSPHLWGRDEQATHAQGRGQSMHDSSLIASPSAASKAAIVASMSAGVCAAETNALLPRIRSTP